MKDIIYKFEVGKSYRYSEIPEESTEEMSVNDYGLENLGQNAIHLRHHETETDIWFIWDNQANEGIFKCVYNNYKLWHYEKLRLSLKMTT
jgi:hypothetical protein